MFCTAVVIPRLAICDAIFQLELLFAEKKISIRFKFRTQDQFSPLSSSFQSGENIFAR